MIDLMLDADRKQTIGRQRPRLTVGQSEIWVPYLIRCAGDVSPSTMKIIMYEGQKKHALRGRNLLPSMAGYNSEPGEGEYRADAAFQKAKPQIRKFGDLLWQRALKASLQGQQ